MRVLTVRQPWAWAVIWAGKSVENRSRNIAGDYRGPVAIHVAQKYDEYGDLGSQVLSTVTDAWMECPGHELGEVVPWRENFGAIIGVVDLIGAHKCAGTPTNNPRCYQASNGGFWEAVLAGTGLCSPWADQFADNHLELANPRPLIEPVPFKGGLGLRRLDESVEAEIQRKLVNA